ncbi:MAG: GPW/gp25 family protein [Sterolibacterium sp.]|nr:GPW/gp25 family protein [Sterolibacterium sp.]
MSGMNAVTGRALSGIDHIRQSIRDILTTLIGSRVERRQYGSLVPLLIDQPANGTNRLRLMAATVMAIRRWEPRVLVTAVDVSVTVDGRAEVSLEGQRLDGPGNGNPVTLEVAL